METIFDFDVTDNELDYLRTKAKNKEEYISGTNDYIRLSDLYILFRLREDEEKADYFMKKLKRSGSDK